MPRAPRTPKSDDQTPEASPDPNDLPPVAGSDDFPTREDAEASLAAMDREGLTAYAQEWDVAVAENASDDELRALILAALTGDGEKSTSEDDADSASPYVLVRATSDEGRVVLFERDSLHPDGEAFIVSDGREVLVGESWGVLQAIRAGTIERV